MKVTVDTIARTVCLALALINQVLAVAGKEAFEFTNDEVYQVVSLIATFATSAISWWKNNSFTKEAIEADAAMKTAKLEKKAQGVIDMCETINGKNGVVASPIPIRSYDYEICRPVGADETLPDEYTLPEERIPDVYDQGRVGACVGFSTCSCAESHLRRSGDTTRLSPGFFYSRREIRGDYTGTGLYTDKALKGVVKTGFVPYMLYPIVEEVPEGIELANERDDLLEAGKRYKPSGYASLAYALSDRTWDNIRRALAIDNNAVIIVSRDYFSGGGHAIMAIGYTNKVGNKKGRYIKFQNSWGKTWSTDGRSEIPVERIDEAYVLIWDEIKLPFNDVSSEDWYFDDVRSVYLSGLFSGTSENTFEPNAPLIRGDVAITISRLLDKFEYSINTFVKTKQQQGVKASEISFVKGSTWPPFSDVKRSEYYNDAICRVFENGIMTGVTKTEFEPKATMTRAEMATISVRLVEKLLELLKTAVPAEYNLLCNSIDVFTDVERGAWYESYVKDACELGIMNGNGDGTFAPEKAIIRCEGAAILHRLFKVLEDLMMQAI